MIKGRYVALIEADIHFEEQEGMLPFDDIKNSLLYGEITQALEKEVQEVFSGEETATVKVTQQYADLYRVEDNAK